MKILNQENTRSIGYIEYKCIKQKLKDIRENLTDEEEKGTDRREVDRRWYG